MPAEPATRGPIFVVGCPRSGTSPFAGWLADCGLQTVRDDRRDLRYPAGYYEHMPLLMFHKALERLPRGADHALRTEPFLHDELLEDVFVRRMYEEAFRPVIEGRVDFVKFPQLALSIDFLLRHFEGARVIGIWRDPRATFRSLVTKEFPREMLPASGIKAVLLWNLYAYHLVNARRRHPEAVVVIDIDRFLREEGAGARLLARLGLPQAASAPAPSESVDLRMWNRSPKAAWRVYHRAMRLAARVACARLSDERRALGDQARWRSALQEVSEA